MKRQHIRGLVALLILALLVVVFGLTPLAASTPEATALEWLVSLFKKDQPALLKTCTTNYANELESIIGTDLKDLGGGLSEMPYALLTNLVPYYFDFHVYAISDNAAFVRCSGSSNVPEPAYPHILSFIVVREYEEWKVGLFLYDDRPYYRPVQPIDPTTPLVMQDE